MPSNMKAAVPELRSRLGTIEQLMAALESQMALLRNEREEVLGKLAAIVYPILSIPPEVTSEIFLRYVGSPPQSPLLLASVCRSWRAIALSTCGLWTYLNSTYRTAPNLAEKLQDWLSRAGGLPVDLYIRLPPSPSAEADRILQKITENSSRWRCLDIISNGETAFPVDLHGPFSSLTQFSLWTTHFYGSTAIPSLDAPHLVKVSLDGVQLINWQTSLPWNQLTTVKLMSSDVDECLEILAHTPHLEVLVFYTESEWLASPNPASSHRILPRLHTISIGSEASPAILDSLTLPSLNHLDLTWLTSRCVEGVESLVTRSRCSPRTLEIFVYYPGFLPVHECLLALPSVRDLWMTYLGGASDDYSALFDTLADDLSIMPALESISFNNCQTDVALLPMVNMLTTRTIDTEGVAKLKSFKLNFSQEDKHEAALDLKQQQTEVELAVDRLRMLRSEGLNVEIQSDFKWFSGNINSQMIKEIGAS